jgi:glycosyltransferase involved in cell wall biosynthesis
MLPDAELTMVGDGAMHERLRQVAAECGVADRTTFIRAVPNHELCCRLADYDLFATHNDAFGIPKAVLEPLLCGLPVVINRRRPQAVAELTPEICRLVDNTPESYHRALCELIGDPIEREALGRRAFAHARTHWEPARAEARIAGVYEEILRSHSASAY